jgi:hypothetical protein
MTESAITAAINAAFEIEKERRELVSKLKEARKSWKKTFDLKGIAKAVKDRFKELDKVALQRKVDAANERVQKAMERADKLAGKLTETN